MRKLKRVAILDGIVMFISVVVMYIIIYMNKHDDSLYAGLSSRFGWFSVLWAIFLTSSLILVLVLSVIIVHKITRNIKKLKTFAILDGIAMIISGVLTHIFEYLGMNNRRVAAVKHISIGWEITFWVIFLASSALLILVLSVIIIHKIIHNIIQKIKKINNQA